MQNLKTANNGRRVVIEMDRVKPKLYVQRVVCVSVLANKLLVQNASTASHCLSKLDKVYH